MKFQILGPVSMYSDGAEIQLKGSKQRTVLAALLLARERVLPDAELGEALWGKHPPDTYQAQIYTHVSRLRRHLTGGVQIVRQGCGYVLRLGSAWFDHQEFEDRLSAGRIALWAHRYTQAADALRAALDLWHGPTLANVASPLADRERLSIEEARMEALEIRIEADLGLGRHNELTSELVGLVDAHPFRERIRAQLMVALHRGDRRAEAFAVYRHGCRLLAEELGVDPSARLSGVYQAILHDDRRLGLAGAVRTARDQPVMAF